jgi:lactoylglutathione lyase
MKTLHTAYRIVDPERSLAFYQKLGFTMLGSVVSPEGETLMMLKLLDDAAVTLELVHDPAAEAFVLGNGFHHLVVQVVDLDATLNTLSQCGIHYEAPQLPGGPDGPRISFLRDPDGYRIELVQWPPGHADGITEADLA